MLTTWRIASISAVLAGGVLGVACGQPPPPSAPVVSLTPPPPAPASAAPAVAPPAAPATASPAAPASAPREVDPPGLSRVPDAAFGGLALGLPSAAVIKLLGRPATQGKIAMEQASGYDLSTWTWPAKGVEVKMDWSAKPGLAVVYQIWLKAPSTLKNPQGIGIGSTRAEVLAGVGSRISVEWPPDKDSIVMGSIFDGVMFHMKGDQVESILVGAGAE